MTRDLILVVSLWLKGQDVGRFEAFEREAAKLMRRHGGSIERAVRTSGSDPDQPFEVHVVRFPDERSYAAYRADPEVRDLAALREEVTSRIVVWVGMDVDPYGSPIALLN